jgi:hypothetical protein
MVLEEPTFHILMKKEATVSPKYWAILSRRYVYFIFSLALQPSAGYGLLVHEVFVITQPRATVGRTPLDE